MPNRYTDRGNRYYRPQDRDDRGRKVMELGQSFAPAAAPAPTAQDERNDDEADMWRFMADVAPVAGGVLGAVGGGIAGGVAGGPLGAIGGATGGATLGHGLGSMASQGMTSFADSRTADREDQMANYQAEEAQKRDRKSALLAALMGLR